LSDDEAIPNNKPADSPSISTFAWVLIVLFLAILIALAVVGFVCNSALQKPIDEISPEILFNE